MTDYTIVYRLDDEQQRGLEAVTALHNQCKTLNLLTAVIRGEAVTALHNQCKGAVTVTPAQLFRAIFKTGTHSDITKTLQQTRRSFEAIIAQQAAEARDTQEAGQAAGA